MHLHACGVWVYAHRQWITRQQRCFFWADASFMSASHSQFLNVSTYAAVLLGKQTNQPFFIEHFPELCLQVICLVSNTQTKRRGITFICLTSTALNHLKLRNICVQTVEGRQTIKNNAVDFFQTWNNRATSSSILTKAKIQPDIYYVLVQSPSCVKNDSPGFLLHRWQALYRPARSAHTDSHYILGKRNLIHSRWQPQTHIYLQNRHFQEAQTVKKRATFF